MTSLFYWISVAGNVLNAILDPILIFSFGLGIGGAAIATVISEYVKWCGKLNFTNNFTSWCLSLDCISFPKKFSYVCFSPDIWLLLFFFGTWVTKYRSSLLKLMGEGFPAISLLVCYLPTKLYRWLILVCSFTQRVVQVRKVCKLMVIQTTEGYICFLLVYQFS